jgi:cytochrome c-type biogenesis protein CcmH
MIIFSIAAVLLSALAGALILQRAAAAARRQDSDPTLAVYRRQLTEIDDLADRGLLAPGELRAARAEASRRLLNAAQAAQPAPTPGVSRNMRLAVLAGAVAAPVLAAVLYLSLGAPGVPDQPFARRLDGWKAMSRTDPGQLDAAQMAAVLETIVKDRPRDAEPLTYLARAQAAAGNPAAAAVSLRKAIRLEPKDPDLYVDLGVIQNTAGQGEETVDAQASFRQALALDPRNATARYHLARARIASGDLEGGLNDWRALLAEVPPQAPGRAALAQEIDGTAKAGHLLAQAAPQGQPESAAAAPQGDQKAFIESMVARMAEHLRAEPGDIGGWARLIRSYAVLGEPDKMQAALDQARKIFKGQPDALKTIDNAMNAPQGSQ